MAKQLDFFPTGKFAAAAAVESAEPMTKTDKQFVAELSVYRVEDMKHMYQALAGTEAPKGNKQELAIALTRLLTWNSQEAFDRFFSTLPPLLKEAISIGAYRQFVDIPRLEKQFGVMIISKKSLYGYYEEFELNTTLRLGVFALLDATTLSLSPLLARIFAAHLPKPAGYDYSALSTAPQTMWTHEPLVHETIPLATAWLARYLHDYDRYDVMRKGMLKSSIHACRTASGFGSFPLASSGKLDALELYARFMACFGTKLSDKTSDPYAFIKKLVARFFDYDAQRSAEPFQGSSFEILCLQDHLQRRSGATLDWWDAPESRLYFQKVMKAAASDGRWFDADEVITAIMMHGIRFSYLSEADAMYAMRIKADELKFDGIHYLVDKYEQRIGVLPQLHFRLVAIPLFKAYCYLMAALGILEIHEEEPPASLVRAGKEMPLSPYDALRSFRVTGLGRWCLGVDAEKPKPPRTEYEAIADDELPLVTFKGASLERRLFLETIGLKLGSERYRITEASFVAGCSTTADIETRIQDFKRLIAEQPAEHWQRLFSRALSKAASFARPEPAYLFRMPKDMEVRALFLAARSLDSLYIRAEGGLIIVPKSGYRKFTKAAQEIGFIIPE